MTTKNQRGRGRTTAPTSGKDGRSLTGRGAARSRKLMVGGVALGLTSAALAGMPAQAIDTNPPTGPGNIEIFPKRDMVAIEGYGEYAGKQAEIKVLRNGTVIGSAVGTVDGTGFLEVNHPGGVCWGAGTDLKVTPDIKGNDEIRVDFLNTGGRWDGARTTNVEITDVARVDAGNMLVFTGTYGAGVDMPGADLVTDPGKFGVEIVNPDMRGGTSAVGERAIGWPLEAGEPLPAGYSVTGGVTSGTDATGGTFEVTFAFDLASDLDLAEAGEAVALGWQAEADPALGVEAFYGMTLFEYHESSGPGFGGCPAGPQEMRPNAPTVYSAQGAGAGRISVAWAAGSAQPEAPAITGYSVTAVRTYDEVNGVTAGGLVRVNAGARSATIEGLTPGELYDVEIATRSSAGDSLPAVVQVRASDHIVPAATANTLRSPVNGQYAALVTAANGIDYGVHLDPVAGLIDPEIHYTIDGSTPTLKSATFVSGVSDSLQIRTDTTVKWIVVDGGNVVSDVQSKSFDIADGGNAAPAKPTGVAAPIDGAVDVTFAKLADTTVSAYRVQAFDATGQVRIGTALNVAIVDGATLTRRVPGLTNGTPYTFTVAARYGTVWSNDSEKSAPVAPVAAPKAVAGDPQTVLRGRVVTLDGSQSVGATKHQWTQLRPAGTAGAPQDTLVTLTGATTAKPTFRFPLMSAPTTDHTLQFRLVTTLADNTTRVATVNITGQPDAVVADEIRWRAGDEIGGTGSQENAVLTLRNGSSTGAVIGTVSVINGEWEFPSGAPALINGSIHLSSDYGFQALIRTTN